MRIRQGTGEEEEAKLEGKTVPLVKNKKYVEERYGDWGAGLSSLKEDNTKRSSPAIVAQKKS